MTALGSDRGGKLRRPRQTLSAVYAYNYEVIPSDRERMNRIEAIENVLQTDYAWMYPVLLKANDSIKIRFTWLARWFWVA